MRAHKKVIFFLISISLFILLIFFGWRLLQGHNYKPLVNPISASKLIISTDKSEYKSSEPVKIIITNSAKNPVVQQATSSISVTSNRFLGKNYGVGLIEKWENSIWVAIEPVWRCGSSCFTECKYDRAIKPGERSVFVWPQTILICNMFNHSEEVRQAEAGKYRVTSAIWSDEEQKYKIIHSNEFILKDK
jgi:hypothetical protein